MATITSRPPADIRVGDVVTVPAFDGAHHGPVLDDPKLETLQVVALVQCMRCGISHSVNLAATRLVAVEREAS